MIFHVLLGKHMTKKLNIYNYNFIPKIRRRLKHRQMYVPIGMIRLYNTVLKKQLPIKISMLWNFLPSNCLFKKAIPLHVSNEYESHVCYNNTCYSQI